MTSKSKFIALIGTVGMLLTGSSLFARRAGIDCHDEWNFLTAWILAYDKNQPETQMTPYVHMYVHGTPWDP